MQTRLDAQRDKVVDAAIRSLSERGYAGCSMATVADRAGIATGSVYRHFPNKAGLVTEVFRIVVGREVDAVTVAAARGDTVPERVVAIVETFSARALRSPRLAYALLAEPVDAAIEAERLVFRRTFQDVIAAAISDGVAGDVLPEQDPRTTAAALVGAVGEVLVGPLSAGGVDDDTVPNLIAFTLRALGGSHVGSQHP